MAAESYKLHIIRALNGWVVVNQGAYNTRNDYAAPEEFLVVGDDKDLGGVISAAILSNRMSCGPQVASTDQVIKEARSALGIKQ